jgi:hypothetical protein
VRPSPLHVFLGIVAFGLPIAVTTGWMLGGARPHTDPGAKPPATIGIGIGPAPAGALTDGAAVPGRPLPPRPADGSGSAPATVTALPGTVRSRPPGLVRLPVPSMPTPAQPPPTPTPAATATADPGDPPPTPDPSAAP